MNQLLEKAFDRAAALPDSEQEALARRVLAEIEADTCWDALFAEPESDDVLTRMADRALEAHRSGQTHRLDPGDL
jgi:hypothetical protein